MNSYDAIHSIPLSDVGFAERVKSEKAKRFWDQLVEDGALSATANYTQSKASTAAQRVLLQPSFESFLSLLLLRPSTTLTRTTRTCHMVRESSSTTKTTKVRG